MAKDKEKKAKSAGSGGVADPAPLETNTRSEKATVSPPFNLNSPDVPNPNVTLVCPTPLEIPMCDYVVKAGAQSLFKVLWDEASEPMNRVAAAEKYLEMKYTPWGPDPEGRGLVVRESSYKTKSPLGMIGVVETHKVLSKNDAGSVAEIRLSPNIPGVGNAMYVWMLFVARQVAPGKTRFTGTARLEWYKSSFAIKMLKGQIDSDTVKDIKRFWGGLVRKEMEAVFGVEEPAAGDSSYPTTAAAASAGAPATALVAAPAAMLSASYPSAQGVAVGGGAGAGAGPTVFGVPLHVVVLGVGLLLVAVALLRLSGQVARSSRALEDITAAAGRLREQLEAIQRQQQG